MSKKTLDQYVSSTDLARNVSKTLDRLKDENTLLILRDSKVDAVILSPEEYQRLTEANEMIENISIFHTIAERSSNDNGVRFSLKEAMKKSGITEEDLDRFEKEKK